MGKNIVNEVRRFVEEESRKPTAKYGHDPYEFHLVPMHDYAKSLAERLGADVEIVEVAAWLHDIGSIINGRKDHHITGAEIAGRKLRELGYPKNKTKKVKHCIFNHRGSQENNENSLEAKIISDADALSNFDNIPGIFKAAFCYEGLTQGEARISVGEKLERKWNKLYFQKSKDLIKLKYEAAMLLLK